MKPINICFISTAAYPLFNKKVKAVHGGAELQLYFLANELAKDKSFDVNFIVGDYGQKRIERRGLITLYKYFKPDDGFHNQIYKLLKSLIESKSDIYVQRSINRGLFILALYCKLFKKKLVYMVAHDAETSKKKYLYKSKISRFMISNSFKLADRIIVQSNKEYEDIKKNFDLEMNRVFLLRKGINSKILKEKQRVYDGIWVGRCEEWKRPDLFIKLAKKNKNLKFMMICSISKNRSYFESISKLAKKEKNITFLANIKNEDVLELLKKSKIFIITSKHEGEFPMTVLESLSMGIPIISLLVNPDNLIDKYELGVFCNGSLNKLNSSFKKFIANPQLRKNYSKKCKEYILQERSLGEAVKKFKGILKGI